MYPDETSKRSQSLVSDSDDLTVIRELHDVPPYRVYEVQVDGRRAVLKADAHPRGHAAIEGRVHAFVASETTVPAPEILEIGPQYYISQWDESLERAQTTDELWARAAGRTLATLHTETQNEFDNYGQFYVDEGNLELTGHSDWLAAARDRLEYHRPYLERVGHADIVTVVDEFFAGQTDVFDGAGGPVFCHGNVHPEHVATTANEATAVIDFEHALVAPGEYDYWRVAMPLFNAASDIDSSARIAFREGYESIRPLQSGFEQRRDAYRLLNLVSYVESLYLQQTVDTSTLPERAARFRELIVETLERLRADGP
ncbi:aminoglycoside phosphotransferase family protein [Natronolimnobius sp. AArcel1]|uniref:aminoglycoside phosphotransferase family protein n=1 Tax=Natronolimnobius sp. AArcel1 TaxID=1679093 RepID=UPI0013EBC3E9|nr:aminoglycoside phosphotransferase family protein [Natronolimnobius sp. AArcel1]NGM67855.1 aminoglycoside phosphotransferase family protein [Natronolimnobius sp. AArcel1]